jgi:hypothetical protein
MGCATAREFALAYALTPKPNRKPLATELALKCKSRKAGAPGAFRVTCKGYGGSRGKLVRFKYRPA